MFNRVNTIFKHILKEVNFKFKLCTLLLKPTSHGFDFDRA